MHPVQYILFGALFLGVLPLLVTIFRRRDPSTAVMMFAWAGALVGGAGNAYFTGFMGSPWVLLPAVGVTVMLLAALRVWQLRAELIEVEGTDAAPVVRRRYERGFTVLLWTLGATIVSMLFALVFGIIVR